MSWKTLYTADNIVLIFLYFARFLLLLLRKYEGSAEVEMMNLKEEKKKQTLKGGYFGGCRLLVAGSWYLVSGIW